MLCTSPLFEDGSYISCPQMFWYNPTIKTLLEYFGQEGSNLYGALLKSLAGSKSGPEALLGLSLSRCFTTPWLVTLATDIDGNGMPSRDGMLLLSFLVHVDSYCLLRTTCIRPFSLRGRATPLDERPETLLFFVWSPVPGLLCL